MSAQPSVLVLDDYPDAAEAVAAWLCLAGWNAICTTTVEDALSRLRLQRPSAVIMEPYLRAGSALPVAMAARKADVCPLLIALTWSARTGDHTAYEPTLFDFNFPKPVSMQRLAAALESIQRPSGRIC